MKTSPCEEALFALALAKPAAERAAFLDRECAGDPALRARLEALLAAHEQPATVFATQTDTRPPGPGIQFADAPDEAVGQTLGRYKLLERIGEGGCGVVYVAEQTEPVRRRVALKVIKLGMDTKQVVARFEAERQALAMMDHPNIAKVLDAGTTGDDRGADFSPQDRATGKTSSKLPERLPAATPLRDESRAPFAVGRPYFVMELVRGIRITDYCDQANLTTKERLDLFIKVCQAIQHAHQKGIIHRDIKPSNILVTLHDGVPVPKVIDFGIAKATEGRLTDSTVYTQLHQFIGTPAYMSPEQAEMSALDIDTRSDIYSLGVLLYEILTGRPPFDPKELMAQGIDAMRRTIREAEPVRPSTRLATLDRDELTTTAKRRAVEAPRLVRLVTGDLDWIVMKCLEKDRTRRYETANGLAADLKRHLENEPVVARPPSVAYRLQKAWRRHRIAFATGVGVGVILLTSVLVLTWALDDQKKARKRAEAAQVEQGRERAKAEAAGQVASAERNRAARLLSVSQAERGVELLEKQDPTGLLYLLEARKSVEHLPEDRIRRTLLWSGWMASLRRPGKLIPEAPNLAAVPTHGGESPWWATGSTNGEVVLRARSGGALLAVFSTGKRPVATPELSANGRLLVANSSGIHQLWDLSPARSAQPPRLLLGRISRVAFDAAGRRLVTFANQELPLPGEAPTSRASEPLPSGWKLQVWDSMAESPLAATWDGDRQDLMNHQFALSADGSKVAAGWHALSLWDARTGRPLQPPLSTNGLPGTRDMFDAFHFSPDDRWLWEVRRNACLRYDLATGQPAGEVITGLHRYNRPWITSDKQHFVVSLDSGFLVLHLNRGERLGPLIARDETLATRALALSADGSRLATAGPDRAVGIWNTQSGEAVGTAIVLPSPPTGASFAADGESVTLSTRSGRSLVYSLNAPLPTMARFWPGRRILGFNAEGQVLVHAVDEAVIQWTDPGTGASLSPGWRVPDQGRLLGVALAPDGRTLATATEMGKEQSRIRFWNTAAGTEQQPSITWTNLGMLAFSPDGRVLAGLGAYGSVDLWDVSSREHKASMAWPHPPQVTWLGVRFSPDGRFLAARNSYALSVWDTQTRQFATGSERDFYLAISQDWSLALTEREVLDFSDPRQPRPTPRPVTSRSTPSDRGGVAISTDNRLRASSERIWEIATGRPIGRELKMGGVPLWIEFSPDSRLLVAYQRDFGLGRPGLRNLFRVWETSTGLPCGPAAAAEASPIGFHFDPEVRWLGTVTFPEDRGAQLLQLPTREVSLSEMERQTWLLAGSRLDEAGDIEVLSGEEIGRLEVPHTPPGPPPSAQAKEPAALDSRSGQTSLPGSGTTALPAEIQAFIAAKEQQARALAAKLNSELPAEFANYFQAALAGNWQQASNAYANIDRRFQAGPFDENSEKLFVVRQPVLEAHIALEHCALGQPKYAAAFGRDVVVSLPAGSIYFGGTDAGRGLVTAFAKSKSDANAIFVLTQNALADGGYLTYARETYGHRIYVPIQEDLGRTFQQYVSDAQRRLEHDRKFPNEPHQLKPGEEVKEVDGRVQISGQVAVMGVNALLARVIFEQNPQRDFYVEESFPLDWMYPHLEPHGLIMRLNREPLGQISPEAVRRDQEFWTSYLMPLLGGWLQEKAPVADVCDFAARVFVLKDLKGFDGDPAYVADSYACKAFSKLRGSQAGLYQWRATQSQDDTERQAMRRAADFAFRQALALCPYNPEVVFRYTSTLTGEGRTEDALRVARLAAQFPETQTPAAQLVRQLETRK